MDSNTSAEDRSRISVIWGRILGGALVLYIVYGLAIYWFKASFVISGSINHWSFSEFLINYQGGFVRRGLLGEILFYFCKVTKVDVKPIISILSILIYGSLFFYFFRKFRIKHIRWWFLASPLLFGFLDSVIRKDFLMGWMSVWMLMLLRDQNPSACKRVCAIIIAIIGIQVHEAFVFWGVPIGMLLLMDGKKRPIAAIAIISVVVCFALSCVFRGDRVIAEGIVESWNHKIGLYPPIHVSENAVGALLWNLRSTFEIHVKNNIGYDSNCMGLFIRPLGAFFAYYLMINFLCAFKHKDAEFNEVDRTNIGVLYLLVSFCMLPMFTFLSNDYARLYQYIALAVTGAFVTLERDRIATACPHAFLVMVEKLNKNIDNIFPPSKGWFMVAFLLWGAAPVGYDVTEALQESVAGKLSVLFGSIVKYICF